MRPSSCLLTRQRQTVCGMSVVGSDWEKLKRFNLAELYPSAPKGGAAGQHQSLKAEAIPESVTTDEARLAESPPQTSINSC
jgi:tRNA acetyltransferase TAN1